MNPDQIEYNGRIASHTGLVCLVLFMLTASATCGMVKQGATCAVLIPLAISATLLVGGVTLLVRGYRAICAADMIRRQNGTKH